MTFSKHELVVRGVDEELIRWRCWRRAMHLSIPEAAAMAEVDPTWLQALESGRARVKSSHSSVLPKLSALMERWTEELRPVKVDRRKHRTVRKPVNKGR